MSLRYRLNKDKFKGKKLPPKIQTNEDHISPDQRGDVSSDDPEFEAIHRFKEAMKKPIEETEFSRRGIFGGLNTLKEYAEKSEQLEQERHSVKVKKKRRKKKSKKQSAETESTAEDTESTATETEAATKTSEAPIVEAEAAPEAPKPKQGIFRRIKEHFYPTYKEEIPKPAPTPASPQPPEGESDSLEELSATHRQEIFEEQMHEHPATDEEEEGEELDRRQMIRESIHFFAKPAVDKISSKIEKVNTAIDTITKRPPLLRPPGAISEKRFLQACTRCDDCANACPKDAIQKVPKKFGFLIMDTPYIDPVKVPCVMCDGLPCIPACQEGALMPVPGGPTDVKMGYAILDKKKCQAYGHTFCQQCVIDCPIPGAITQKEDKPVFHKDICTGCGVCVRSCSTVNIPVAIKIKPWMVIEHQLMKKEQEKREAELKAQMEAEQQAEEAAAEAPADTTTAEAESETDPQN